ncbi:protein transport protein sec9 [Moniliophthora roreri MCA 2997]|uniref:Protein transport protein sec9 n=2 Tax=Moniliophthora roreri TaxID=221103 RepID=V2XQ42_MONRO|nr:protein transport protein sec9 [Moniliophthora roreri MCA 2997]KAI3615758.1 protein transport protein sec9 [Moniliophthora roreri]
MPLLKRKEKNLIPPVESEKYSSAPSSTSRSTGSPYHTNASTYIASRDGDSYKSQSKVDPYADNDYNYDKYSRSNGIGDVYSRGDAQLDVDRNELFAGYNPEKAGSGRFFDGPGLGREPAPGEENDEDVEGIKQQTRFVKQESVNSTRNALRLAREAEETGRGTLTKLGDQSERLANTEMHLDMSKSHSQYASDKTDELKKLNRSIFRPAITFNKDAKRRAQEAKIQERYEEERSERERTLMDVRETQNRLGRAATYGRGDDEGDLLSPDGGMGSGRFRKTEEQGQARRAENSRYRFEATASDDELEDEIDDNLDELSEATKRLKALGMAMSGELDAQNTRVDNIISKTDRLDMNLANVTRRQKKF